MRVRPKVLRLALLEIGLPLVKRLKEVDKPDSGRKDEKGLGRAVQTGFGGAQELKTEQEVRNWRH